MLHEVDEAILALRPMEDIVKDALRFIRSHVPCRGAAVAMLDDTAQTAIVVAADAGDDEALGVGTRFPLAGMRYALRRLRQGYPLIVDDILAPSGKITGQQMLQAAGVRSFIAVPLSSQDKLTGMLALGSEQPHAFSSSHVEIAQDMAKPLAVAIQNAQLFAQVRAGRQRLQDLSRRLVEVQETERRYIAHELHDQIGQTLTGLKLILEMAARAPAGKAHSRLDEAQSLLNELMTRVRELSLDLRPAMLDDLGLLPALLWRFERYLTQTNIQVNFNHSGLDAQRFAPEVETAAYRIVQEALTNVARHAQVSEVVVQISVEHDALCLKIRDRGRGFDSEAVLAAGDSSGLAGMHERVNLLGGRLRIDSAPGTGTNLIAELPLSGHLERRERRR